MKDQEGSTSAGATRDGDSVSTDPALSSHTFRGSADRVALRITPRGDAAPGSVKVVDAANQPVSTTAPPAAIVVRHLYPDTIEPATAPSITPPGTPPPEAFPPAQGRGRRQGMRRLSRQAWFGIAAIIVALLAIGFLALQSFGRTSTVILPTASATAIVQATTTPALAVAPTLAPTAAPLASTPITPTEAPLPTVTPTEVALPTVAPTPAPAPTAASTEAPVTVPSAVPPTSVPAAPPAPAVAPAAPAARPAIPPLPPGISLPATRIPSVPQVPRKP